MHHVARQLLVAIITLFSLDAFGTEAEQTRTVTYERGHFTVTLEERYEKDCVPSADDTCWRGVKQTILGGEFTPPALLPAEPPATLARTGKAPRHVIFVSYSKKELTYYRRDQYDALRPVIGYVVVTPDASALTKDVIFGEVTGIVKDPTWCPNPRGRIRRDDPTLPPGCFPPGHRLNAMSGYRFDIAWQAKGMSLVKLHGASGYPARFEAVETYGCTRLEDTLITALVAELGPTAVAEGIALVAMR